MANYDSIDMNFSWDGDYDVGKDGDIETTEEDLILSMINEVQNIVKSETSEWEKDVTIGANLLEFQGEPNSREIGTAIENRVTSSIANQGLARSEDISVRVIPVHANQVLIMIRINADSTAGNSLSPGEPIKIDTIYDTLERSTFFLLDDALARNAR